MLNDFGHRGAIRQLYGLGALQGIAVNLDLVCTVVCQDSVHTSLLQLPDHLWGIFKLLLAIDADLLEGAILIAQADGIKVSAFFGAIGLKNYTSDLSCRISRCSKEVDLEVIGFKNDIELERTQSIPVINRYHKKRKL